MATRANIIIKDKTSKKYFYRHYDGYPEGTLPTLRKFMDLYESGFIQGKTPEDVSGWLTVIGLAERTYRDLSYSRRPVDTRSVGTYEPTKTIHGDIEYLYVIDLDKKEISIIRERFYMWRT